MKIQLDQLAADSIAGKRLSTADAKTLLDSPEIDTFDLLHQAYKVRKAFCDKRVTIHILNNAKNGNCPEDCSYCVQAKSSKAEISDYPIKSDDEILAEAKHAYESGAHRYCMVFSGRGPSKPRVRKLSNLIKTIKETYPIEICLSPGLVDQDDTDQLKEAGLDRLNHNLNTAEEFYKSICTTHTYEDRVNTLKAAKNSGLEVCSGMIAGMGEETDDIIEVANKLRDIDAESIPVNFYMAVEGSQLGPKDHLSPDRCLRILSIFRLINPKAEIRMAAGREIHLRSMQVMGLYAASSLFMDGYLNAVGSNHANTLQMIKDAGFDIESDHNLDELLEKERQIQNAKDTVDALNNSSQVILKSIEELRPQKETVSLK